MALKAKETLSANQLKVGADTGYDNDHEIIILPHIIIVNN